MKLETQSSCNSGSVDTEILFQISPRCQPQPPRQVNTQNYSARLSAPHQISISASQCFLTRLSLTAIKAVLADGKHVKTNLPFAQSRRGRLLAYAARREISRSELIPEGWETYLWDTGRQTHPNPLSSLKAVSVKKTSTDPKLARSRKVRHPPKQNMLK